MLNTCCLVKQILCAYCLIWLCHSSGCADYGSNVCSIAQSIACQRLLIASQRLLIVDLSTDSHHWCFKNTQKHTICVGYLYVYGPNDPHIMSCCYSLVVCAVWSLKLPSVPLAPHKTRPSLASPRQTSSCSLCMTSSPSGGGPSVPPLSPP